MAELKIIKMSEIQPEPVEWLWEPYIPKGKITLIQGDGGLGKTTVSLAIAAALSTGNVLPGIIGYDFSASVIVQNAEDSYTQTIRPRLEALGADCDMIHVIDEDDEPLSFTDERIEQTIIQKKAALCVIDPVQAYFRGANMNSANSVRPIMKHLGKVAERHNCAILLVGHLNKAGSRKSAAYRGLGSIDIYSAARSVMSITKIDENTRVIVHDKSNLAPNGAPMAFGFDPIYGFNWHGEYDMSADDSVNNVKPSHESQSDRAKTFIRGILENGAVEALKVEKMAENRDISKATLNRAKSAVGAYSVKRGSDWFWELPIETHFTECTEDTQDYQENHMRNLIIFNKQKIMEG